MKIKRFFILIAIVLLAGCSTKPAPSPATSTPSENPAASDSIACTPAPGEPNTIATAKLIIEYNSTDGDIGVHGGFDDHGWSELCVYDPNGVQVLAVKPQEQLKGLTMASIFFESREPPSAEFTYEDLKAKFPEGQYEVRGITFEEKGLTGFATFTHDVPMPPTITWPLVVEEENVEQAVVPATDLVVAWEDVTKTLAGDPVTITGYEVIITKVEHTDPHGFSKPIFDVHVPPDRNTLSVSAEFIEPDTVYDLEVLALEESGNQTITTGFFKTEPLSESLTPFKEALARIEYNATDGDLGFQVELDAPSWMQAAIFGPDGTKLFEVKNQGSLGVHGLTHLYFESTEKPLEELSRDQFLARFPEGVYTAVGVTVEGKKLMSPMEFTHLIPDPPRIISPAEGKVVSIDAVVIACEPVSSPKGVEIDFYQLFFFPVDPQAGQAPIELNIDFALEVPSSITQVKIPAELLTPGTEYQFEIKAFDANGNTTVTVGSFKTEAH